MSSDGDKTLRAEDGSAWVPAESTRRREAIRLKTLAEQETRERELALAQETQVSLLPRSLPQFENFSVHAYSRN